jgi:hypothetical protein
MCSCICIVDKTAEDLKLRTKRFAIKVLDCVDTLPSTVSAQALARQLARAGLGVAGNYVARAEDDHTPNSRPG